jgi:hypothetical protein
MDRRRLLVFTTLVYGAVCTPIGPAAWASGLHNGDTWFVTPTLLCWNWASSGNVKLPIAEGTQLKLQMASIPKNLYSIY